MSPSVERAAPESRSDRRKRETRERLLDAALRVFLERGFDGATTSEITSVADLGAGTFYLHFRDKRDVYETLARRAARDMIDRWRRRVRTGMALPDRIAHALEIVADFWAADRPRARLLLEGGPTFGAEAHVQLVDDLATLLQEDESTSGDVPAPEVIATLVVGLALELGRIIVAHPPQKASPQVAATIALVRRMLASV